MKKKLVCLFIIMSFQNFKTEIPRNRNLNHYYQIKNNSIISDIDQDGVPDELDLDNDNDGILDTDEGRCYIKSNFLTDGFDTPLQPNLNNNNVLGSTFNGWTTRNGSLINILKTDGTVYDFGPNLAKNGSQYVDLTQTDRLEKTFTTTFPSVISASAWFSNRVEPYYAPNYNPWIGGLDILDSSNALVANGNQVSFDTNVNKNLWFQSYVNQINIANPGTYKISLNFGNSGHVDAVEYCVSLDTDGDGTPNYLDLDSDNDGCPDAIEGEDHVAKSHLDTDGSILGNVDAQGVPEIVNPGGNADVNSDAGQLVGNSNNASVIGCACYKLAQNNGDALDSTHGITALGRAGSDNGNWPMVRKGAWTVLESNTKGFVINRLTDDQINDIPTSDLRTGMMVYNISQDCLQININGTSTGWKCFNKQTCPN